ncbi:UDP-N-acetylmuramoylalanine--D-glutamate ligase [Indibacter alkaliphilus LW1]|uniref:UDP-N-acetylmuramoylalanine--D-glutamate ligase n=1 Tax=Indibacter alkaliphilus (strain CCUG 57479 / KCTC 22604 / LW1) TaxID=1189612 RepID=S2DLI5_INDAL|nr:UDP-N-acetylmuramoyl-L-alanine--D-glutamate ligase [Indibacter alkaliphilus]EOZ99827.1 UDP-N-acetylmuramoylalanine--D-glutamate ligase [Indibacter alkaliphilus LW1]
MEKRVVILGAGESGVGAAMLAKQKGYAVWVSDLGLINEDKKELLRSNGIPFEEGEHSDSEILNASEIIKSPGIPLTASIVQKAISKGIKIIDELEFASRYSKGNIIGITGTNGKTTTTLLTYHLLKKGGFDVGLAGNVGQSWSGQLTVGDKNWWVIEMSSFQLDGLYSLKPKIAILTNITPDHLDRYGYQIENYIASKVSIFKNMKTEDSAIFYADDQLIGKGLETVDLTATPYPVSLKAAQKRGGYYSSKSMDLRVSGKRLEIDPKAVAVKGKHNAINTMMASLAALLAGVDEKAIKAGLSDFQNASHRMEEVSEIEGVRFVNDSKGTNVDATKYALEAFDGPLIWIAGGVDKGNDYSVIEPLISGRIEALICLGKDNMKLREAFVGKIEIIKETQEIAQAVRWGLELGRSGAVVLLSPACASFDLFKNYEDRGEQFKKAVQELKTAAI